MNDTMGGVKRSLGEDGKNGFATRGADWDVDENGDGVEDVDKRELKRPKLDEVCRFPGPGFDCTLDRSF